MSACEACQKCGCANVLVPACTNVVQWASSDNPQCVKYVSLSLRVYSGLFDFSSLGTSAGDARTEEPEERTQVRLQHCRFLLKFGQIPFACLLSF